MNLQHTFNTNTLKTFIYAFLMLLVVSSCSSAGNESKQTAGAESYKVIAPQPTKTTLHSDFPASLEGKENIEIRPKVEGFIQQVLIDEGEHVKKGQLLFVLEAPQYEQAVNNAKAMVESAEAEVNSAQLELDKVKPLVKEGIVSNFRQTSAENSLKVSQANLAQARTELNNAYTNVSYTKITSPVDGVVGTLPYKLGSLVTSTTTEPLTTISNIEKVYAYFSINEKTQLSFERRTKGKNTQEKLKNLPEVELILADNSMYEHKGRIQTVSGQVDEETGSFNVRAVFDNPENLLRTGNSAIVRIPRTIDSALIIPQSATYEIQGSVFVFTTTDSNTVKSTKIGVTPAVDGKNYIVNEGLKTGDRVVIEGITKLNNGDHIEPVLAE